LAEETEKERIDREVIELLNELRVTLPGVQVLFAFLLILPFQPGFAEMTGLERTVYMVSFLTTTASTILLMTPASYHRLRFRAGDKLRMLMVSNRLVIVGMLCLAVAVTSAVFLIAEVLVGDAGALGIAAAAALAFGVFWYAIPLYGKLRGGDGDEDR
jgi:Kef-type K+ transport system membrane component KefB